MRDHADIVYAVIPSSLAQVVIVAVVCHFGFIFVVGFVVKKVRLRLLVPSRVVAGGCRQAMRWHRTWRDPSTLAVFAVIGLAYAALRLSTSPAPRLWKMLLGRLTEGALLRTYQMSGGDIGFC